MVERVLVVLGALAAPLLALLAQSSRRTRLRHRIDEYLTLAERVSPHDDETAKRLRVLAQDAVGQLIRRDEDWLHKRFDPYALLAIIAGVAPAVAIFVLALGWDSGWRWPVLVLTAGWALLWSGVGITQLKKEQEDEAG
jgi:VIT1/CCC1 family predicted Fe2+/Mn2+ transporter